MNDTIQNGIEAFNKDAEQVAVGLVARKIRDIKGEQNNIASYRKSIAANQEALQEVLADAFTPESVFGGPIPVGPNSETMKKAIADMNEAKQANVTNRSKAYTADIVAAQSAIKACEERIAKYRTEAAGIRADTTTATEVLG